MEMRSLAHRLGGGCRPAPAELLQLSFATAVLVACQLMTCGDDGGKKDRRHS